MSRFLVLAGCIYIWVYMLQIAFALTDGEKQALRQLFDSCENAPSIAFDCTSPRTGIVCNSDKRLAQLYFAFVAQDNQKPLRCNVTKWDSNRIDMQAFTHLSTLNFRKQGMHGKLPASLGELPSLARLDMSDNELKGELQNIFGENMQTLNLRLLDLSDNSLIGTIPARLAQLPLRTLRLHHNQLTGRLPANMLAENSQLMDVAASHNLLTGPVSTVGPATRELDLDNNKLSGPLPRVASGALRLLSLSNNRFNESIPTSYKTLHSLRSLSLDGNELTGLFPELPTILLTQGNFVGNKFMCPLPKAVADRASCYCHKGSAGDKLTCELCSLGYYNPNTATAPNWVKSCTACEPGTYTPRAGAERCENRSLHTTQDVEVTVPAAAVVTDEDTDLAPYFILYIIIPSLVFIVLLWSVLCGCILRSRDDSVVQKKKIREVVRILAYRVSKGDFTSHQAYHIFINWKKSYLNEPTGHKAFFFKREVESQVKAVLQNPKAHQSPPPYENWSAHELGLPLENDFQSMDGDEEKEEVKWVSVPNTDLTLPEGVYDML